MAAIPNDIVAMGHAIVDIVCPCEDGRCCQNVCPQRPYDPRSFPCRISPSYWLSCQAHLKMAGGAAVNAAVGVASFGGRATFVGRVGDDRLGNMFRHDIKGIGVTFRTPPAMIATDATSRSLVLVTPDGQRTMLTYLGCSSKIAIDDIDAQTIKTSKILHLEGYLFEHLQSKTAMEEAVGLAAAAGKLISFALPDSFCVHRHRKAMLALVKTSVDVLFASESEILSLYQAINFEETTRLVAADVDLAVLTRSEKGSVVISKGEMIEVPAENVQRVVDATGAGDLYAAGFLYAMRHDTDLESAALLGGFAAAEIISQFGARPEIRLRHLASLRDRFRSLVS